MNDEEIASLALNRIAGVGPATFSRLVLHFSSASAVFNANRSQLQAVKGSSPEIADSIRKGVEASNVEQDLSWLKESASHQVLFADQNNYPEQLARIYRPPPVLFLNGNAELLSTPQLSIVGSRNPTTGGIRNARAFATELTLSGLTITSGLAGGIDGAAHQAALDATSEGVKGKTIAVAATGLDRIYPAHHSELAHAIAEKGLIVSEFPIGTGPLQANFPRRNRIISGLSLGTLVVEAARRSGSLITARCAMEQDREVFAIPGSIHSPQSRGCHWLIKQGAKLVETSDDIAEEILMLLPTMGGVINVENEAIINSDNSPSVQLSVTEQHVFDVMGYDPITMDSITELAEMKVEKVLVVLSQLELISLIDALPGGRYCRKG